MRLNRYVAAASRLSRRGADDAIAASRVTVNGQPGVIGASVDDDATVTLDGRILNLPVDRIYVELHKPKGYVVSRNRQGSAPTIYDLLPPQLQSLNPVGRLDKDSSGLILLSNDGDFLNRAMHPSAGKEKVYELTLDRTVTPDAIKLLQHGVELEDGPSKVRVISSRGAELTVGLQEGRNRQLRRTAQAIGYVVRRLHRVRFGAVELGSLAAGEFRVSHEAPVL